MNESPRPIFHENVNTRVFIIIALVMIISGCYWGDRVSPARSVILALNSDERKGKNISSDDLRVKAALGVIDKELEADGFVRLVAPQHPVEHDLLAFYVPNV